MIYLFSEYKHIEKRKNILGNVVGRNVTNFRSSTIGMLPINQLWLKILRPQ